MKLKFDSGLDCQPAAIKSVTDQIRQLRITVHLHRTNRIFWKNKVFADYRFNNFQTAKGEKNVQRQKIGKSTQRNAGNI